MNQLTAPSHTLADRIPLWLRIREIMKERGNSYSLNAMAVRLGIGRETLRLMLNGEREIYSFELEKIALDLKMPLHRLLQEDVNIHPAISQHITNGQWEEALRLARQRQRISIGLSERAQSFCSIGFILFWKNW